MMENSDRLSNSMMLSPGAMRLRSLVRWSIEAILFIVASCSTLAVLFIIYFIGKDAVPFIIDKGLNEFFFSTKWYPSGTPPNFGALSIIFGTLIVTLISISFAVPLGVVAAVCLSDILPFKLRQIIKPVIEILAAIPSVAFGFFALVVFAPLLQNHGGSLISFGIWIVGLPIIAITTYVLSDMLTLKLPEKSYKKWRYLIFSAFLFLSLIALYLISSKISQIEISSGTNAFNVSIILAIMALPTIVSVSEDSLQAAGTELRQGSYALGATRAETMIKIIIPSAMSGIIAAVILGIMRAIGETMVVWMASGNAAQIPTPIYNIFDPIRTLTATIAGDMGEADHTTGSARYHVLFVMALVLLLISLGLNIISEYFVSKSKKMRGK